MTQPLCAQALPALLWKANLFLHSLGCRRAQRPLPITQLISVPPESELLEKEVVEGNFTLNGAICAKCQQVVQQSTQNTNAMQMCLTTEAQRRYILIHLHTCRSVCVFCWLHWMKDCPVQVTKNTTALNCNCGFSITTYVCCWFRFFKAGKVFSR